MVPPKTREHIVIEALIPLTQTRNRPHAFQQPSNSVVGFVVTKMVFFVWSPCVATNTTVLGSYRRSKWSLHDVNGRRWYPSFPILDQSNLSHRRENQTKFSYVPNYSY